VEEDMKTVNLKMGYEEDYRVTPVYDTKLTWTGQPSIAFRSKQFHLLMLPPRKKGQVGCLVFATAARIKDPYDFVMVEEAPWMNAEGEELRALVKFIERYKKVHPRNKPLQVKE
jgi:hypothetical protein